MREIRVRDVGKCFPGDPPAWALQRVSFEVPAGQFVSILGASGSGKSTLLRIMGGLTPRSHGAVTVDDNEVTEPPADLVYLFQQYGKSLFPWKTALDNVAYGVEARARHGQRRRGKRALRSEAAEYLAQVGLAGNEPKYPHQLSGGMQQRIAIARAIAAQPKVLLMDEPFSAVDALTRMELQDLILDVWRNQELTVVFVTHDIDEAIYLSDRILVLRHDGDGFVAELPVELPRPRHQVTTRETGAYVAMRRELHGLVTSGKQEATHS